MADQSVRGRFVWHELMTPDAAAAHAFYSKAIGWKSQPWEEDPSYVMFAANRGLVGASTALENGDAPHWLPYIGTGDIEQTIAAATDKGASVVKPVDTLSSGSKYAVLQDPFGATFGLYESADEYGQITEPQTGEYSWHELMSTDHEAAFDFYSELFGWEKLAEHDMGDMGVYLIWGIGGRQLGGMMKAMEGVSPAWTGYVFVKDVNQTAKKVKSAGGQVVNGPMEVPGGDWIVQLTDPQGALFAAHASSINMKKATKPKAKAAAAETPAPIVEDPDATPVEEAPPAEKEPERKAPARKSPAKRAPAAESEDEAAPAPAKKAPAKKSPARKSPAKKAPAKKAPAKKSPAKRAPAKSSKKPAARKGGKKQRPAARGGGKKSVGRKSASKSTQAAKKAKQKRSGGNKRTAKKPRKGK